MSDRIEITIPVLNEEQTIENQVVKTLAYFDAHLNQFPKLELVIADNGSTDDTPAIARRLEQRFDNLRYMRLEKRGVGLALKASWSGSDADIVGYMDLDLATDLKYLAPALNALVAREADVVTGSRLAKGAKVVGRTPLREFTSRSFNMLVKMMFNTGFTDGMCGFKFLRREHLERIMSAGAESDGWFFATELLLVAEHLGLKVKDLPVEWTDDPNSKVNIRKLAFEYMKAMRLLKKKLKQDREGQGG